MARDKPSENEVQHIRSEPRPDFSQPLPRKKLPAELQATLDNEEKLWESITSGSASDSTDSSIRYAAYASRFRTILLSAHRYVAYTSDIGESFRPIAHPNMVRAAYGISWAYLVGDVAHEGYKAYTRNQKILNPADNASAATSTTLAAPMKVPAIDHWASVMAERAVFQSIASMGLPAFTIHSIVRYSGQALKNAKNQRLRTWGPIGLGLAAVPALPFMFDKPVEIATEWVFHKGFEFVGGPEAVGHRHAAATVDQGAGQRKEKEL
nr:mitochondrial fission process protein 1 [Quercus suber]